VQGNRFVQHKSSNPSRLRTAFTLVEVLVTLGVIAVLIALLLPSLASVNESARRVVCQSNLRQIGTGVLMYADDNHGFLIPSVFLTGVDGVALLQELPQEMITLRATQMKLGDIKPKQPAGNGPDTLTMPGEPRWDGLGRLYELEYIQSPKIFYCPSHRGTHRFSDYADQWAGQDGAGEIIGNFHYRGEGPTSQFDERGSARMTNNLFRIDPSQASLLSDGMREQSDFNHRNGSNFFRADLTVHWFNDRSEVVYNQLAKDPATASPAAIQNAWTIFDSASGPNFTTIGGSSSINPLF
jgi:prepilin-type N-terminal cleavage/methylation domain-containing protein